MNSLEEATRRLQNIVRGCQVIWESGNKELIAKMHNINDYYQNQRETIIYGDTIKNLREKMAK